MFLNSLPRIAAIRVRGATWYPHHPMLIVADFRPIVHATTSAAYYSTRHVQGGHTERDARDGGCFSAEFRNMVQGLANLIRWVALPFLSGVIVLLAVAMLVGPPVAVVFESIDIARMRALTTGRVVEVETIRGGKGTSRNRVRYSFTVGGQDYQSARSYMGFLADRVTWTGGGVVDGMVVGAPVAVHYDPGAPQRSALERGWFKVSVGLTAIFWGMAVSVACASPRWRRRRIHRYVAVGGTAIAVYGWGLLLFGPAVVRIVELRWHAGAWLVAVVGVILYRRFLPRSDDSQGAPRAS